MIPLRLISEIAPPTPPCFPSRDSWAEYLHSVQASEKAEADRPFDKTNRYKPSFDFCEDCDKNYCLAMQARSRCKPRFLQPPASEIKAKKVAA